VTRRGLLFDPTRPDPVVLTIDGPDYLATGWAADLDGPPSKHRPGCRFADLDLADACACQPAL
jgi:hypothetical protein